MNKTFSALLSLGLLSASLFGTSQQASAHGYVESPASRAYQCRLNSNTNCGSVQYEPQSIEGKKGFPQHGPADGQLASRGIARFHQLDEQSPLRWHKVNMKTGNNTFNWALTATHRSTSWRYFITKQGWDDSQPLARASFELTPFCEFYDDGTVPPKQVKHDCKIPTDRSGSHVILAVWDIEDTGNAFYQAIDVNLSK